MAASDLPAPKYRQVYEALLRQILSGRVRPGARLPSEADMVQQFGASRITVARALRELQLAGLIERRAGSGTYVGQSRGSNRPLNFGMLIPDFGTVEIFAAICRGMLEAPEARAHALAWACTASPAADRGAEAWQACQQYITRRVDGVFFAPLEHLPDRDAINRRIADALAAARIPVVLIDRSIEPYPHRGLHDLVGIDNRRAGALITDHLLDLGCRRLTFVGRPDAASTVDARQAGFREALGRRGLDASSESVLRIDPSDADAVERHLRERAPDGLVCASDRTAGLLTRTLIDLGWRVPDDVRLVGIDDVEYAALLRVPLTTLRQPANEIGVAAMAAMVERVSNPDLPPRDILLHGKLVVRESCGQLALGPIPVPLVS